MLACYLTNAPVKSRETLEELVPDIRPLLDSGRILPPDNSRPQIVKTHFLPDVEVMQPYRPHTRKILYLVRNPRDVIISSTRLLEISDAQKGAFAKSFIANRGVPLFQQRAWGKWPQHVLAWTSPANVQKYFPHAKVLIVRYEDLRSDPVGRLQDILGFLDLGAPVDPARVQTAVESSSLKKMRAVQEIEGNRGLGAFHIGDGLRGQSLTVLGQDVEEAYQRLLQEDTDFLRCAQQFGYGG